MRTPIRKPGKYAGQKGDPHLTSAKYAELEEQLERLKTRVQPRLAAEVRRLASDGDFSENVPYQVAKGKLRGINQRILEIEGQLARAEIITAPVGNHRVAIGHTVTIGSDGKEKTYLILGSSETDPARGVISHLSPLGQALIGRRAGEIIKVELAGRVKEYKILNIGSSKNFAGNN